MDNPSELTYHYQCLELKEIGRFVHFLTNYNVLRILIFCLTLHILSVKSTGVSGYIEHR